MTNGTGSSLSDLLQNYRGAPYAGTFRAKGDVQERFWVRVQKTDTCWVWRGRGVNRGGYGVFTVSGRPRLVHRLAYELEVGPIPEGLTIDHLCRNKLCVRPDHLEPVSLAENIRRSKAHRRPDRYARHRACKRGHPLTGDNVCVSMRKGREERSCKRCRRDKERQRRYGWTQEQCDAHPGPMTRAQIVALGAQSRWG